jgi:type III secretory pathway component EscT
VSALLAAEPASLQSLAQSLAVFLLLCARLFPIAWLVPWASVRAAPAFLPALVTVVLATCLWPVASAVAPLLPSSVLALAALAVREVLLGLVYAVSLALPMYALQWSGALVGTASMSPEAEQGYATLQRALGVAAFFALGGHRIAIAALADSLARRPIGLLTPLADPSAIARGSAQLLGDAFALAVLVALPVLGALMLAQWLLSVAARAAGAGAFAFALLPLRGALVPLLVSMSFMLWLGSAPDTLRAWFAATRRLWEAL